MLLIVRCAGCVLLMLLASCESQNNRSPRPDGYKIFLGVQRVDLAKDSFGRAYLAVRFKLGQLPADSKSDPAAALHSGYAILRADREGRPWRLDHLSESNEYAPPSRVSVKVTWNTRYGGILNGQVDGTDPSTERMRILTAFACSDIMASVYVTPDGSPTLERFVPRGTRSRGASCV